MPIEFLCDQCGTKLRTPDDSGGKKTKCPGCEAVLTIPELPVSSQPSVFPASTPAQPSADGSVEWQGFENPGITESGRFTEFNESGNPWQAPADFGDDSFPNPAFLTAGVTGDQLGFNQAFRMTYNTLKSNFLPFFVLGVILIAFMIVFQVINVILNLGMRDHEAGIPIYVLFVFTCAYIVQPLLTLGLNLCALELIRTRKTSFATGFSILPRILSLFVFFVVLGLLSAVVIGLPIGGTALIGWAIENAGGDGLGWIVGLTLGIPWYIVSLIVIVFRFGMFGPLLIVDQKVSAFEAFSLSWNMTKRNTMTLLNIFLVFGIAATIAICITLYLGIFVLVPFGICLTVMCYHILWEQYSAKNAQQQVSEW